MYICLEKEAVRAQKPLSLKDHMLKIFRRMNSATTFQNELSWNKQYINDSIF